MTNANPAADTTTLSTEVDFGPIAGTLAGTTETPRIPVGISTILGILVTLAGLIGTIIAAVEANDTATIAGSISTALTLVATVGGRFAQAIAAIVVAAKYAEPFVEALADIDLRDPEADRVPVNELPDDDVEFASPPPAR